MSPILDLPPHLAPLAADLADALTHVQSIFDAHLASDLAAVNALCRHIEHYRGKMLRPTLCLVSALAAHPRYAEPPAALLSREHLTIAAVCEMVHMATLVHDDVLDEADTRRRRDTVNRLHGNETAVILGDYLIASAYHLCSGVARVSDTAPLPAETIARASVTTCAGELLQLHHRGDFSLDEPTYFEIISGKTAALIAAAAELGAAQSGAEKTTVSLLREFGRSLGIAFQIQDDLLDLTGKEAIVGKSVGKDLEKGKVTLPFIHHLAHAEPGQRARTLVMLESAASTPHAGADLYAALQGTNSIEYARTTAERIATDAEQSLTALPDTPARAMLHQMARAVVHRTF